MDGIHHLENSFFSLIFIFKEIISFDCVCVLLEKQIMIRSVSLWPDQRQIKWKRIRLRYDCLPPPLFSFFFQSETNLKLERAKRRIAVEWKREFDWWPLTAQDAGQVADQSANSSDVSMVPFVTSRRAANKQVKHLTAAHTSGVSSERSSGAFHWIEMILSK